jgi:hypothetical protein
MAKKARILVRGDVPLARAIFNDPKQRRLITQLQNAGWPIFLVGKKRAAWSDEIAAARDHKLGPPKRKTRRGLTKTSGPERDQTPGR